MQHYQIWCGNTYGAPFELDIVNILQIWRLTYFGHVICMAPCRYLHISLHGYIHGQHLRGRPQKKWMDNICEDCAEMDMVLIQASHLAWDNGNKGCQCAKTTSSSLPVLCTKSSQHIWRGCLFSRFSHDQRYVSDLVLALGWSAVIYQPLMIPNCPGAITLDTLVFISGHQDRLPVRLVTQSTLCIVLSTQFSEKLANCISGCCSPTS